MRTCLICDDHAMMREALSGAVTLGWPGVAVTQAADYPAAWAAAAPPPDLILCDLTMPGSPPLEGIARLRRIAPSTPILVITGNEDDALLLALFEAGIAGFCPKTSRSAVIEAAVRLVLAGGRYLPPEVLALAGANSRGTPAARRRPDVRLTARQDEILRLMAEGASNKDIARLLDLSPATVKTHAAAAFAALGAANRTEAVIRARSLGLI
ncbi:response regulator transcription factor [Phenylobacterium sp.]|uniref:response regulator transcription factor n=1 Tax=Phenylobacterium sp. TaxID=1871053 RepID=UPI00301DC846